MTTKEDALKCALAALNAVQDAASYDLGGLTLDARPIPPRWTIGPREDIPGGLMDAVRQAISEINRALRGAK